MAANNRLQYACDAGISYATHDSTQTPTSPNLVDLAATSIRVFSESMARTELAELEMLKSREAVRLEAQKRRAKFETEMSRMMLQTPLQVASLVAGRGLSRNRKRKRVDEGQDESPVTAREGALLLSLLQCTFQL